MCYKQNLAVTLHQTTGFNHAFVIDHGSSQVASTLGTHIDHATVRLDQALVGGQCVGCAFVDRQFDEAVTTGHIQGDLVAASQGDGAHAGRNNAFVAHFGGQQSNVATLGSIDRALIDHSAGAIAGEGVAAAVATRCKVCVRDAECGGHQAAHVHLGSGAKQHARGV